MKKRKLALAAGMPAEPAASRDRKPCGQSVKPEPRFGMRPLNIPANLRERINVSEMITRIIRGIREKFNRENIPHLVQDLLVLHDTSKALGKISGDMRLHLAVTAGAILFPKGRLANVIAATGFNAFINRLIPRIDRQLKTWILLGMTSAGHMGIDRLFPESTIRQGIVLSNRLDYLRLGYEVLRKLAGR